MPVPQRAKRLPWLRSRLWFARALWQDRARVARDEEVIRRHRPDVVLVRQDAYCRSVTWAAVRLGVPVVTYADAPVGYESRHREERRRWHPPFVVEAVEKWGLRRSAAVVTVSSPAAEILRGYGLATPVVAVPNGVDPTHYPLLSASERQSERQKLGLTASLVVGFQGTFQGFHGVDQLRDLMLATAGRADTQWLLVGDGPEREGLRNAVAGKANAVFLGRRPHEAVGRLLGLVDVAVAPYTPSAGAFYGCPMKVLEYAAAGCAALASDQGDTATLLNDGRAGVVLRPDDRAAWRAALLGLLDDPARRAALGRAAREWVLSRFTWRHTAARVAALLGQAVGPKRKRDRAPNSITVGSPTEPCSIV